MSESKEKTPLETLKNETINCKEEKSTSNTNSPSTLSETKEQVSTPTKSSILNFFNIKTEEKKKKVSLDQISTSRIFDYSIDLCQLEMERPS